jgi:hypothetical protein
MTESSQYSAPIVIGSDGIKQRLKRRRFAGSGSDDYSEDWLQDLLFAHAELLPVDEIDRAYERLVPICRELETPAGPLDVLYATPDGRLVIVEAKLWRNPEARRKVIGQILDYATELSQWSYEDLQREVSRATGRTGNCLFEIVRERYPEVEESRMVDDVTRALKFGNFLLLIVGDGIREGAASIANFLDRGGNLHFGLGLVEMAIFDMPGGGRLVQPRVLAKTVEIKRTILLAQDALVLVDAGEEEEAGEDRPASTVDPNKATCIEFWGQYLDQLRLDDQSQPIPKNGTGMSNRYFSVPPKGLGWIAAWIGPFGGNKAGVYITFQRGPEGDSAYQYLEQHRTEIDKEIGLGIQWENQGDKHWVSVDRQFENVLDRRAWPEIHAYLSDATNRFVNAFRHRLVAWDKSRGNSSAG